MLQSTTTREKYQETLLEEITNLQKAKFHYKHHPQDIEVRNTLKECRRRLQEIEATEDQQECRSFFSGLAKTHPSKRMRITYDFYRRHKQKERRRVKNTFIPMSKWEKELDLTEGSFTDVLSDEDPTDLGQEPTLEEIDKITSQMRNGTAPGIDHVVTELYKANTHEIKCEILAHINIAWTKNVLPATWTQSIQVPLPKKANPKTVDDYRRISICTTGYRIYANFLLGRLDTVTKELGNYQAAFLSNRSTDDHMFTLRRILDEEWKAGETTFVLSIDLEKAFDTVDLNALRDILLSRTNRALTNRIVKAAMNELTCIKWYGQQTRWVKKGKGVKQGCPLSPRLFTILMDDVFKTLEEELPCVKLNQDEEIRLPLILAFADDVIIVSKDLQQMNEIYSKAKSLFATVGLKVNDTKTRVLVRDPVRTYQANHMTLDNVTVTPVKETKYLGTYITSNLCRNNTVNARCKQGMRNSKALTNFIKESRMQWQIVRLLYKMVIEPTITYGLKCAALTKANRSKLRRYERIILRDMINNSGSSPKPGKVHDILKGKTITKKIKCLRICYLGHILRRPKPHLLEAALRYKAKKLKVGRPIYTWEDSLSHDMDYYPRNTSDWQDMAKNKGDFIRAAREIYKMAETDSESEEETERHTNRQAPTRPQERPSDDTRTLP